MMHVITQFIQKGQQMQDSPATRKKTRKKGDSIDGTSLRYLAMLEAIPRSPYGISVEQIMNELAGQGYSIDKRTIQRDLPKLEVKFGLECKQQGRTNFWSYKSDAPPRMFPHMDEHTALSFQLVKAFLRPLLPPETVNAINPWFEDSGKKLSGREGVSARWAEKIHVRPLGLPRQPPNVDQLIQDEVYQATLRELSLKILYLKRDAKKAEAYLISPLGLVIRDHLVYLVAAKNQTGELRYFALHRIRGAEKNTEEQFIHPQGFNLKRYADEKFGFQIGQTPTLSLKLRLNGMATVSVAESPISTRQTLSQDGEAFILTVEDAPNTFELRQWLRSMGKSAEIIEPGFLRAEFAEEITILARRYGLK
ncbi:MAG: WYL domain-containing protein [Gallionella sp.]|nr:WYL domain-containing protein [Gallionella sp.]